MACNLNHWHIRGILVPEICLGTMTFGEQNTQAKAFEQLDYALERGA